MLQTSYSLINAESIDSPALIYYRNIIVENTLKAIQIAGSADRLWPHVKTHKSYDLTKLMMNMGISRFKCATIAEAEMLADCNVPHILLAYPLVGTSIARFLSLIKTYPSSHFYAIGDDEDALKQLSNQAKSQNVVVDVLIDINLGMNRSGVSPESAFILYEKCSKMQGISLCGLHCYDGHHNDKDFILRCERVEQSYQRVRELFGKINQANLPCSIQVMGGTPSFPCHARHPNVFLSPGTCFVMDNGYATNLPDLPFVPGAAILTRVISHPDKGLFTLDLGYKGIASDPLGLRGVIINYEDAEPIIHSEEHWVWRMPSEKMEQVPPVGSMLYVIPTHICPTSALYPFVLVAEHGTIQEEWEITARNRRITI